MSIDERRLEIEETRFQFEQRVWTRNLGVILPTLVTLAGLGIGGYEWWHDSTHRTLEAIAKGREVLVQGRADAGKFVVEHIDKLRHDREARDVLKTMYPDNDIATNLLNAVPLVEAPRSPKPVTPPPKTPDSKLLRSGNDSGSNSRSGAGEARGIIPERSRPIEIFAEAFATVDVYPGGSFVLRILLDGTQCASSSLISNQTGSNQTMTTNVKCESSQTDGKTIEIAASAPNSNATARSVVLRYTWRPREAAR